MEFLTDRQLDRRAHSDWGIRFPPYIHPGAAREALTLLLQAGVPPYAILRIFQAFGVVFEDRALFTDKVEAHRVDLFRLLGMAVVVAALCAMVAIAIELVSAAVQVSP